MLQLAILFAVTCAYRLGRWNVVRERDQLARQLLRAQGQAAWLELDRDSWRTTAQLYERRLAQLEHALGLRERGEQERWREN